MNLRKRLLRWCPRPENPILTTLRQHPKPITFFLTVTALTASFFLIYLSSPSPPTAPTVPVPAPTSAPESASSPPSTAVSPSPSPSVSQPPSGSSASPPVSLTLPFPNATENGMPLSGGLTILSPIDGATYETDSVNLNITAGGILARNVARTCTYILDETDEGSIDIKTENHPFVGDVWGETTLLDLANGQHSIFVILTTTHAISSGTEASTLTASVTFFVNKSYPYLIPSSPRNTTYYTSGIPLDFSASKTTNTSYSLDGQANVSITGATTLTDVPDGLHSLVLFGTSEAGSTYASGTVYFGVDTGPPKISILSIENKTYYAPNIPLAFSVTEPSDLNSYSLDGQANVTITGNTNLTGLALGTHTLRIYAEDMTGNTGASATVNFSVAKPFDTFPTAYSLSFVAAICTVLLGLIVYFVKRKPLSTGKVKGKFNVLLIEGYLCLRNAS